MRAACVRLLAGLLCARAASGASPGGSIGAATDDVFRGQSQSDQQPSVQGELHDSGGFWFFGASAELVERGFGSGRGAEVIGYGGLQSALGEDWLLTGAARHYDYPGSVRRAQYNYDELQLSLRWQERLVLSIAGSPDTFAADYDYRRYGRGPAWDYELSGRQPLLSGLYATAGAGVYDLTHQIGTRYGYANAGLAYEWRAWQFDMRYVWTDDAARRALGPLAQRRLVASLLWFF